MPCLVLQYLCDHVSYMTLSHFSHCFYSSLKQFVCLFFMSHPFSPRLKQQSNMGRNRSRGSCRAALWGMNRVWHAHLYVRIFLMLPLFHRLGRRQLRVQFVPEKYRLQLCRKKESHCLCVQEQNHTPARTLR